MICFYNHFKIKNKENKTNEVKTKKMHKADSGYF